LEWAQNENQSLRATAYWLLGRLLLTGRLGSYDKLEELPFIWKDVLGEDIAARNSALLALKQMGRRNPILAKDILAEVAVSGANDESIRKEICDTLSFEFEYFAE
jgi:hypothetical protein